jgi:hypothetical protein
MQQSGARGCSGDKPAVASAPSAVDFGLPGHAIEQVGQVRGRWSTGYAAMAEPMHIVRRPGRCHALGRPLQQRDPGRRELPQRLGEYQSAAWDLTSDVVVIA